VYPEPDQIAKQPEFPSTQNLTGLSWFSCKAESAQYPINHSTHYLAKTQQLLRRAYYVAVSFTDSLVDKLLPELDPLGLAESTVVGFHGIYCLDA
jgi:membrane-anchored protein YejM (alkaline phosphatase superfamily)